MNKFSTSGVVFAVAGGTGSGKSTLVRNLKTMYGKELTILYIDNYFKSRDELPRTNGVPDRDHPDAIDVERLIIDLKKLIDGQKITAYVKDSSYKYTKKKVPIKLFPRPIIIVEGFFALYYPELRASYDTSVYLDMDIEQSLLRRVNLDRNEAQYVHDIVVPAHTKYIAPTAKYAGLVIDVSSKTESQVLRQAVMFLQHHLDKR